MKWLIILDRYGDESKAKGENGKVFSIHETAEKIVAAYSCHQTKPVVEVCTVGIGQALADLLRSMGIPVVTTVTSLKRIGSADIYQTPNVANQPDCLRQPVD